ncbi:MAG: 30S ribosomal protein S9 [Deltaproteobacteria bacterium]|nr:MAG: 30S ribosomal protein S9 [Deltaproteobacteria bacterium]
MTKKKIINTTGKRKKAIARATIRKGSGVIRINSKPLEKTTPRLIRMRIQEPLLLAPQAAKGVNIDVTVKGGGIWGQADACRTAIANALVKFENSKELKQLFRDYDRSLLISDSRRTEPHKPSRSSAGPRRKKQQSKR